MLMVNPNEKQYKFVNSVVKILSKKKKIVVKKIDNFLCVYTRLKKEKIIIIKERKKIKLGVINGRNIPFIYNHTN